MICCKNVVDIASFEFLFINYVKADDSENEKKKKKVKEIVYPASWNFKIYKYKAHSNRTLPFPSPLHSFHKLPYSFSFKSNSLSSQFSSTFSSTAKPGKSLSLSLCGNYGCEILHNFAVSDSV